MAGSAAVAELVDEDARPAVRPSLEVVPDAPSDEELRFVRADVARLRLEARAARAGTGAPGLVVGASTLVARAEEAIERRRRDLDALLDEERRAAAERVAGARRKAEHIVAEAQAELVALLRASAPVVPIEPSAPPSVMLAPSVPPSPLGDEFDVPLAGPTAPPAAHPAPTSLNAPIKPIKASWVDAVLLTAALLAVLGVVLAWIS